MNIILLRLDAPLMSFGSVIVDNHNFTDVFAYRSMLTGLIANALGMCRADRRELFSLQNRLLYAARRDRNGELIVDYQTMDLGRNGPMNDELAWTFNGRLEKRLGSAENAVGTHIRYRHYVADSVQTVALTFVPEDVEPTIEQVSQALQFPARPLFIGRKCCIPSGSVWLGTMQADSLRNALQKVPRIQDIVARRKPRGEPGNLNAIWPCSEQESNVSTELWPRVEDRDALHSIHVGRRLYVRATVDPPSAQESSQTSCLETDADKPDQEES